MHWFFQLHTELQPCIVMESRQIPVFACLHFEAPDACFCFDECVERQSERQGREQFEISIGFELTLLIVQVHLR